MQLVTSDEYTMVFTDVTKKRMVIKTMKNIKAEDVEQALITAAWRGLSVTMNTKSKQITVESKNKRLQYVFIPTAA